MKRKRHTPEQIVRKLREGDRMLNEGTDLTEVLRHLEVSESSWARWRAQYGGMKADEAKRLKELERENARLKKLLAEAELEKAMLKELAEGNFKPRSVAGERSAACRNASGSPNGSRAMSRANTGRRNANRVRHDPSTTRTCGASSVRSRRRIRGGVTRWPRGWWAGRDGT